LSAGFSIFATDHFQFRLFLVASRQVHRAFHPNGTDQADDKAQAFDVHIFHPLLPSLEQSLEAILEGFMPIALNPRTATGQDREHGLPNFCRQRISR
jgi:hypothetical protein